MASTSTADVAKPTGTAQVPLPYITIKFCLKCKWNLRAAYFAQELLQTFSTTLGGIALVPVTGGIFTVTILHSTSSESTLFSTSSESTLRSDPSESTLRSPSTSTEPTETLLWDRKTEGGFPETKELKNRVRNVIDPGRDMGHIDRRLRRDREGKDSKGEGEEKGSATEVGDASKSTSTFAPAKPSKGVEGYPAIPEVSETQPTQQSQEECEDCK